jgi:hypothetical protein
MMTDRLEQQLPIDTRRGGLAVDDFSDIAVDLAHIDDAHPGFAAK